jgi:hypothetical protein
VLLMVSPNWKQDYPATIGWMTTPRSRDSVSRMVDSGRLWCCDNGCFSSLDKKAYVRMLREISGQPRLLWVTAPDVVGDAEATLKRFKLWRQTLRYFNVPIAYVLQDGQEGFTVPWDDITAVFVGGSTFWKLSSYAAALCRESKERGKWVHMGRVNTVKRLQVARSFMCDSVDGSSFCTFRDKYIPLVLPELAKPYEPGYVNGVLI